MPPETDNLRLGELYEADQADRSRVYAEEAELAALRARDEARRREARAMVSQGQVNTPADLYRAGMLFFHGSAAADFLLAHRLSMLAALHGSAPARWLCAASLDRLLMSLGRPQVYGTQFERDEETGRYQLRLPVEDSDLLHFEKRVLQVPGVHERLEQLNRGAA